MFLLPFVFIQPMGLKKMKHKLPYVISFFSGFLSLALEIIWMRIISFAGMTVPQSFSYTLALFLIGISIGAYLGKIICKKINNIDSRLIGSIFLIAAIIDIILFFISVYSAKYTESFILIAGVCVLICASIRGMVFPLVHHIGTSQIKSGSQISNVYFSNVFGSSIAPILISFIALDYFSTQQVYFLICMITLALSFLCVSDIKPKLLITVGICSIFFLLFIPEQLINSLSKDSYKPNLYPSKIIENKHGFIQVYDDLEEKDQAVFGANVYDGKLNTNIFHNTNGIDRAYLLPVLKPEAKEVLVIGLSTGSWVQVLSTMPNIKKITVVEINPAYAELVKSSPIVSEIFKDKRIDFVFDDGRKWIKKNKNKKFDIILINTTWHWRAYSTNLLSADFLNIVKSKLNADGIIFYNSTMSSPVYFTANHVFPFVYKYKYFVLASMQPVKPKDLQTSSKILCELKYNHNQKPVFMNQSECDSAANIIMKNPITPYKDIDFSSMPPQPLELITDDNMIIEYKYGKGL